MELDFAWLANAAEALPNGLFYVLGGGVDQLTALSFPATQHNMSLVVRLLVPPEECNREYIFLSEIVGPNGRTTPPDTRVAFTPGPHPRHLDRANFMTLIVEYRSVIFPEPGDYRFRLSVDGVEIGSTILEILQAGQGCQT